MFTKKYELSTNMKIDEIVRKLNNITIGKNLIFQKRVQPDYIGNFDNTGFKFRRGYNIVGTHFFSANYFEQDSITNVSASIKTSAGTLFFYFSIDALILLSLLIGHITLSLVKITTISLLLSIPALILYFSFEYDKREAEKFLHYLFDINGPLVNKGES